MFEGNDSVFNSNICYKSFKTYNLPVQNSYCDHRNFDSLNQCQNSCISLRVHYTGAVSSIYISGVRTSVIRSMRKVKPSEAKMAAIDVQ